VDGALLPRPHPSVAHRREAQSHKSDGKVNFRETPPGHVFFAEAETHSAEIIGGAGTRSYIIELNGNDWKPSTGVSQT